MAKWLARVQSACRGSEDEVRTLRDQATAAVEHHAKQLEDAEKDKNLMIRRLRQEVTDAEVRADDLERLLSEASTNSANSGSGAGGGAAGAAAVAQRIADGANVGSDSGSERQPQAAAPPRGPALLARVPPVLSPDPAQLLLGYNPEVGFATSDIDLQVHEFAEHLSQMCNQPEPIRTAAALIDFYKNSTVPRGAVGAIPSNIMEVGRPAILAHVLMHWLQDEVWADPLRFLDSSVRLGTPLPACGGPTPAPERNLVALLESHAARSWLPVVRGSLQAPPSTGACAWGGDQTQSCGIEASVQKSAALMSNRLAVWLRHYPSVAEMVKSRRLFLQLLLRALHMGLFVKAAHPLLRLRVATPVPHLGREGSLLPLDPTRQESLRRVRFTTYDREAIRGTGARPFVLYSTRPAVLYDAAAAAAAGALGTVGGSSEAMCLIKEEVVSWMWAGNEQG
ncbi:hypothetical protein GPECTOR_7g1188 [Gonium pectorale]|uniref:Uncharacterized protein n=1 Tax=Gonium pectorale TaxID=33097 RepID=A0A150GU36_GONPE|nr:hypothetical protein GPECTOR_7g1188 [Gonium pectorale]|eukprot:KXZ53294.1 hypothetical protein GPECTOR_7g1188 [Gonium pectorale]